MFNLEGWDESDIVEGGQGRDGREVIAYGWIAWAIAIIGAAFFVWRVFSE